MKTTRYIPIFLLLITTFACNKSSIRNQVMDKSSSESDQNSLQKAKNEDDRITDKYWKLIELEGKEVITSEKQDREAHFVLHAHDQKIVGHSGCNSFNGSFEITEINRIKFNQIASTRMACPDMLDENTFLQVLNLADNFSIHKDTLSLNKARMAPLAKFKAVYLY